MMRKVALRTVGIPKVSLRRVALSEKRSQVTPPKPPQQGNYLLMEDGNYMLYEDGSKIILSE